MGTAIYLTALLLAFIGVCVWLAKNPPKPVDADDHFTDLP